MKRKLISIALVTALVMVSFVGASLAYFQDTETITNTFTMGDVKIDLMEDVLGPNDTATQEKVRGYDFELILPGDSYQKEPYIVIEADSVATWIAAKITVDSTDGFSKYYSTAFALFDELFDGGVADEFDFTAAKVSRSFNGADNAEGYVAATAIGDVFLMVDVDDANNTYDYYLVFEESRPATAADTVVEPHLFTEINIPSKLQQGDIHQFHVDITAYAIQKSNVANAYVGLEQFVDYAVSNDRTLTANTTAATTETVDTTTNTTFEVANTPAGAPAAETTVEVPVGALAANGDYTLEVATVDNVASDSVFTVNDGGAAVATLDLDLINTATNAKVKNFENGESVTVTTYIQTGLSGVEVVYNGKGDQPTDVTYNPATGELSFKTNHFSEFVVTTTTAILMDSKGYDTLVDAIAAVETKGTIEVLKDTSGAGIFLAKSDKKNITVDFNGYTYTCTGPAVGSTGTQTQAWHLEKDNTVVLKNGTVTSTTNSGVYMLIQNYCNLTLTDMNVDFVNRNMDYALSNNCGVVTIDGNTTISVASGKIAFDACVTNYYPDGAQIAVRDGVTINGNIEYGVWGSIPANNKVTLTIDGGVINGNLIVDNRLADDAENHIFVNGGTITGSGWDAFKD